MDGRLLNVGVTLRQWYDLRNPKKLAVWAQRSRFATSVSNHERGTDWKQYLRWLELGTDAKMKR